VDKVHTKDARDNGGEVTANKINRRAGWRWKPYYSRNRSIKY